MNMRTVSFVLTCLLALTGANALPRRRLSQATPTPGPAVPIVPYSDDCYQSLGGDNVTVLLVADPGDFTGSAEAKYYAANMQEVKQIAPGDSYCPKKFVGKLLGQKVTLITTGIGPTQASLCTQEILRCGQHIKEIVFSGTSGWSLQKGGVLNSDNCSTVNPSTKVNRFGDVCVTPFAVNWDCKEIDWTSQCLEYPNLCFDPPEEFTINATFLFGDCIFNRASKANLALADEIAAAAHSAAFLTGTPHRNVNTTALETRLWTSMKNYTGVPYAYDASLLPVVHNYTECVEVDSQFFFYGDPFEMAARNYAALTINLALNTTLTKKDVQIANAEEGVGVAMAIERYNAFNSTVRKVPYTFVRGQSDWLTNTIKETSPGVWEPGTPVPNDFVAGYAYAIVGFSSLVMSWLQGRCIADLRAMSTSADEIQKACYFTLAAYGA